MTHPDERYVETLREALTALFDGTSSLASANGNSHTENSKAAIELETSNSPGSIVTALAISQQLIEFCGEHLSVFVKVITEPIEPLACWTCVRSMLEACAIATWLLDPSINTNQRIRRTFAYRHEGLEQQRKLACCIDQPASEIRTIVDRIEQVAVAGVELGYRIKRGKNHNIAWIAEPMPSATDMIQRMLDEESMYRLLSAVAHGHCWAITKVGFGRDSAVNAPSVIGSIPVEALEKEVHFEHLALLGLTAARAFARPLWNQYQYMGWDPDSLEEMLEDVFDTLRAKPSVRFWRTP